MGSPEEAAMEAHIKVRSFTSGLNATSVRTGSSNWTKAAPGVAEGD